MNFVWFHSDAAAGSVGGFPREVPAISADLLGALYEPARRHAVSKHLLRPRWARGQRAPRQCLWAGALALADAGDLVSTD
jgi:hypothetical protein